MLVQPQFPHFCTELAEIVITICFLGLDQFSAGHFSHMVPISIAIGTNCEFCCEINEDTDREFPFSQEY